MKKIAFSIPEELDERLRAYVEREFKGVKGALSITAIKAIEKYYLSDYISRSGRLPVFSVDHAQG